MNLLVLPVDGIDVEIVYAALHVLRAADRRFGLDLVFHLDDAPPPPGEARHHLTLREASLEKAKGFDGVILGTQSHADDPPPRTPNLGSNGRAFGEQVATTLSALPLRPLTRPLLAQRPRGLRGRVRLQA